VPPETPIETKDHKDGSWYNLCEENNMGKKEADFSDASRETMAVEDRQRYLDQRLIDINQYAYKNAPAVKNKMDRVSFNRPLLPAMQHPTYLCRISSHLICLP